MNLPDVGVNLNLRENKKPSVLLRLGGTHRVPLVWSGTIGITWIKVNEIPKGPCPFEPSADEIFSNIFKLYLAADVFFFVIYK